jgi:hypothetical protein
MSVHACPCCRVPTLEAAAGDSCPLCFWQDVEGANTPYSLGEAQANAAAQGHMFRLGNSPAPREGKMRERLLAIAQAKPFDPAAYCVWRDDWTDWSC